MSNYDGVNHAKADDPKSSNILNPGTYRGKVHCFIDTYEALSLADGSTINVGPELPVGAMVVAFTVAFDALGTSATLQLGDSGTADRYMTATAAASAGRSSAMNVDGIEYQVTDDTHQLLVTLVGGEATGTIKVVVFYVSD